MRFMIKSCWGRTLEFLGWLFGVESLQRSGRKHRQVAELYRQAAKAHRRMAERKETESAAASAPQPQPTPPRAGSARSARPSGSRAGAAAASRGDGMNVRRIVKIRIDNILHPRKQHTGWPQDLDDRGKHRL